MENRVVCAVPFLLKNILIVADDLLLQKVAMQNWQHS